MDFDTWWESKKQDGPNLENEQIEFGAKWAFQELHSRITLLQNIDMINGAHIAEQYDYIQYLLNILEKNNTSHLSYLDYRARIEE